MYFSPLLKGYTYKQIKQLAQTFMYDFSQLAGAKGGQVSFTDLNLYAKTPEHYKNAYAMGKGGQYMVEDNLQVVHYFKTQDEAREYAQNNDCKVLTYGDFENESLMFAKALLEVSEEGDAMGLPFGFPKLHLHINDECFKNPKSNALIKYASKVLSKMGNPYIDFDRNAMSMSQCCFDKNQKVNVKINGEIVIDTFENIYNRTNNKTVDIKALRIIKDTYEKGKVIKIPRNNKKMYKVTLEGVEEPLIETQDHINVLFDIDNVTSLEVKTESLKVGDIMYCSKSKTLLASIISIEELKDYNEEYVYCFEMEDKENPYFELANGVQTHNCRLVLEFTEEDKLLLATPEEIRFVGGQCTSINLANLPLKVGTNEDDIYKEVDRRMNLAVQSHIQRYNYVKHLAELKNSPLKFYTYGMDKKPYVRFDRISWLIGIVGLNEYVWNLTGSQLHESKEAFLKGMELIVYMSERCKKLSKEYGMNFKLEETPAESTAGRFAKLDIKKYGTKAKHQENELGVYYTNSVHFNVNNDLDYIDILSTQSKFHPLVEAGSMIHCWVGDRTPNNQAIYNLLKNTWDNTKTAEMTITPDKTTCACCNKTFNGFHDKCPECGSENVKWTTRITGYQVVVKDFDGTVKVNDSKNAEIKDRTRKRV